MTAPRKALATMTWDCYTGGCPWDPDFGSDREWRLEEIMEHRERRLNVSEVHWAQEDSEFLVIQEWELEIAYRQLLDSAQQQGGAPFAWDYQEIPVDNSEILAEESTMWQSNSVLCQPGPAAMDVEVFWRMEQSQGTSPAEVLATGQRFQDLCHTSVAVPEAQGEKEVVTSQKQIRIQGEKGEEVFVVPPQQLARVEEAVFPPQQRSVHLGDSTTDISSQQPDEGMEKEAAHLSNGSYTVWEWRKPASCPNG
ncbi:hypothetical protein AB205_0018180 [Aquarana catesbeiana]|uniref:Uncharacterized protein n=1 Tax=Aquarana catesbeiana TaxID=8400 RepID=A0A2G9QIM6_AQUCT|nr:hypothetical protein AB205_0018180 [Aquarana catesbeiana]